MSKIPADDTNQSSEDITTDEEAFSQDLGIDEVEEITAQSAEAVDQLADAMETGEYTAPTQSPLTLDHDYIVVEKGSDPTLNINCGREDQVKTVTYTNPTLNNTEQTGVIFVPSEPHHALIKVEKWHQISIKQAVKTDQFLANSENKRQKIGSGLVSLAQSILEQQLLLQFVDLMYDPNVLKVLTLMRGGPVIDLLDLAADDPEKEDLVVVAEAEVLFIVIHINQDSQETEPTVG